MDKNSIMVSVYCLVYNHEKYVGQTLESFVKQKTTFRYEVIVHDDASTDSSAQIIAQYAKEYPEIIKPIYQEENQCSQGKNIFTNFIFPLVRGKYIATCEGDDFWSDEKKLQIQVDFLENHKEYSACVHNVECWDYFKNKRYLRHKYHADTDIPFEKTITGTQWATSAVMYRKEYGENRPDFFRKTKFIGDYPLGIYLTLKGKVRYIDRVMSVYRNGIEGSWSKRNYENLEIKVQQCKNGVEMLHSLNQYTKCQYEDVINRQIAVNEYQIEEFREHYSVLKKEPYRWIYRSSPISYKAKIFIKQYFNWIYCVYRRRRYNSRIKEPNCSAVWK